MRPPADPPAARPRVRAGAQALVIALVLCALAAAALSPAGSAGFVNFDDPLYVTANPRLADAFSPPFLSWAFTSFHAANWHPLAWLSHALDVRLFGLDAGAHHRVNLGLHAANTALLFLALSSLTGARWRSAAAALLFAVHPLHVESAAWISERKGLLSAFFSLLAVLAHARYARRPAPGRYLLTAALLALALMAKPMAVTLPLLLLLLDCWPLGRFRGRPGSPRPLLEKLPLLALAAGDGLLTLAAQGGGGAVVSLGQLPPLERFGHALLACAAYLRQTLWPADLAFFYPHGFRPPPAWQTLGLAAALLGVTGGALALRRRLPFLAAGWGWFLLALLPVLGLLQVGMQARADRYTYVPLIGLFVAAAWGAGAVADRSPRLRAATLAAAAAVFPALAAAAFLQARHWRDDETLFRHALAVTRGNWMAHNNLGVALKGRGRTAEAAAHFAESLRISPRNPEAHLNLGAILAQEGRTAEAIAHYREGLEVRGELAQARLELARLLLAQADLLARGSDPGAARRDYEEAIRLRPDSSAAHRGLGLLLARLGEHEAALAPLRRALQLYPYDLEVRFRLGAALRATGRLAEAIEEFQLVLGYLPGDAEARAALAEARRAQRGPR